MERVFVPYRGDGFIYDVEMTAQIKREFSSPIGVKSLYISKVIIPRKGKDVTSLSPIGEEGLYINQQIVGNLHLVFVPYGGKWFIFIIYKMMFGKVEF